MQTLLITGGSGLIGRHLIDRLKSTFEITVLTRDKQRTQRLFHSQVATLELDSLTSVDEYDVIVNLAGEPIADHRWSDAQKSRICCSRWQITEKIVELINQSSTPPKAFISGSAIGIYGRQNEQEISEDFTDYHDEFSHQVCLRWEQIALRAKIRTCILRTGIVLAEDGGALQKMLMPFRLGLGGPIGDGKQFMSWIHIEDMIRGIEFLIENDHCNGPFNLTSPNPNTNHFFSLRLAERLERPCFFKVPAFAMKFLMGESSDLVLYGQKVIPVRLQAAGFHFNHPTLADALKNLDL